MTEEEKAAALEAENKAKEEAEAKAKAEAEAIDEQTPEEIAEAEAKVKAEEESQQLEAQLKREQEASEAKDKIIADQAFKLRDKVRKDEDEPDEVPEEDKPVTRKDLHTFMAKERKSEIEDIVSLMSDNDKERELIILTHKNRTYPPNLSLKGQLKEAYIVANLPKIQGENQELKRALSGKKNASKDASTTQHDAPKGNQPKLAPADAAELTRQGWKWSGTSKKYEKKMPGGRLIRHKDGSTEFIQG